MTFPPTTLRARWGAPSGYREVLALAVPLILSSGFHTLQLFVDRMFLFWHDTNAFAAALPAGLSSFAPICFFMGAASYVNTFAAQYTGAQRPARAGAALWQAVYFCLGAGLLMLLAVPLAAPLFNLAGHPPAVRANEIAYFQILCLGAVFAILGTTLEGFYAGIRKPMIILWLNLLATLLNIFLTWVLVFGHYGFPSLGIRGAGWATVIAGAFKVLCFAGNLLLTRHRRDFQLLAGWRFDRELFLRLMRFGLPNGAQFFVDISSLTIFLLLLGRLGAVQLSASNLAFQINLLAFLPLIGFGIAVTALTGRKIGQNDPEQAAQAARSALQLACAYIAPFALAYFLTPRVFIRPFTRFTDPVEFHVIETLTVTLLRFVAIYSLFDAVCVIYSGVLKGAGDTRFVMLAQIYLGGGVLVLPAAIAVLLGVGNIYWLWVFWSGYIGILSAALFLRYRGGKWKQLKVIESAPAGELVA